MRCPALSDSLSLTLRVRPATTNVCPPPVTVCFSSPTVRSLTQTHLLAPSPLLQLAGEMQTRGVERNVHTYTALMNVLIKCSKHGLALDTYRLMRQVRWILKVVEFQYAVQLQPQYSLQLQHSDCCLELVVYKLSVQLSVPAGGRCG